MNFKGLTDLLERFGISSRDATDAFKDCDSPHNVFEGMRALVMMKWDAMGDEGRRILAEDFRKLMSLKMTRFSFRKEIEESEKEEEFKRIIAYSKEKIIDVLAFYDCIVCDKKEVCPLESKKRHVESEKAYLLKRLSEETFPSVISIGDEISLIKDDSGNLNN